jgi:hypothetical protein
VTSLRSYLEDGTGDGSHSACKSDSFFHSFHPRKRFQKRSRSVGVAAVEVTAFQLTLKSSSRVEWIKKCRHSGNINHRNNSAFFSKVLHISTFFEVDFLKDFCCCS